MPTGAKEFRVSLSPEAKADLREIRDYIAFKSSKRKAAGYIRRLQLFCEDLAIAPRRGEEREYLRPGLRTIGFERRVSVLFAVFDEERLVEIEGFHYGGRQHE